MKNTATTKELQQQIMDKCHAAGACIPEFKRLNRAAKDGDHAGFIQVLMSNHSWCISKEIYTAPLLLEFDAELLLDAGISTQATKPISFEPEQIGGVWWKPFNEGADLHNPVGGYETFEETNDPAKERHVPTNNRHKSLVDAGSEWGIYQDFFGRLFAERLFIPAAGYRSCMDNEIRHVGNDGYYWSSAVSGTDAMNLHFYSSWLNPSNTSPRGHGFQVRCLQEAPAGAIESFPDLSALASGEVGKNKSNNDYDTRNQIQGKNSRASGQ